MDILLVRNFRVTATITCLYTPESITYKKLISNIVIELWHKAPLEAILLGRTSTDKNGVFLTDIEIDSPIPVIVDGKISDVFLKAYYNDVLISDSVASNITLNEGYNDLKNFDVEISDIEIPVEKGLTLTSTPIPPYATNLLFQIKFKDKPLSSEYDLNFTVQGRVNKEDVKVLLRTNADGYVQLETPFISCCTKDS
jgi:hypothetical protein